MSRDVFQKMVFTLTLCFSLGLALAQMPPMPPPFPDWDGEEIGLFTDTSATSSIDIPDPGDPGDSTETNSGPIYVWSGYHFPTNGLWLEIFSPTNENVPVILHGTEEGKVYGMISKTDLTQTNWYVEQMLHTVSNETSIATFVPFYGVTNCFLWAKDWTDLDVNANGLPDWWEWEQFGDFNQTADGDYDGDGVSNLAEFQNHSDPNNINFTLNVGTGCFNTTTPLIECKVFGGKPAFGVGSSAGISSNGLAWPSDAWLPYDGRVAIPLGQTDGVYQVRVGLKGHSPDSQPTWVGTSLVLDRVAPSVGITTPLPGVVTKSFLQIRGWANERLSAVSCLISNAVGVLPYSDGFIGGSSGEGTYNFSCLDVPLTNGLNTIIVTATDLAGNQTTTNLDYTLDYSSSTNPVLQISWPPSGAAVGSDLFTIRGWIDDETATISVTGDSLTAPVEGIVERNGSFWVENLPLVDGTNQFSLAATNAAGKSIQTTLSVVKSPVRMNMNAIPANELNQSAIDASGTISVSGYTVQINGADAVVDGVNWSATNVPVNPGGTAVFSVLAAPKTPGTNLPVVMELNVEKSAAISVKLNFTQESHEHCWFWGHFAVEPVYADFLDYTHWEWSGTGGNCKIIKDFFEDYFEYNECFGAKQQVTNAIETWAYWDYNEFDELAWYEGSDTIGAFSPWNNWQVDRPWAKGHLTQVTYGNADAYWTDSESETITLTLKTGGKSTVRKKNLFVITGSASEMTLPFDQLDWQDHYRFLGRRGIDPSSLTVAGLGKNLGSDGKLYAALADNEDYEITLQSGVPYYEFNVTPDKYKLEVTANTHNFETNTPEFCVGQQVTLSANWLQGLPPDTQTEYQWIGLADAITRIVPPASTNASARYILDRSLLTNNPVPVWWYRRPGNTHIFCIVTNHFSNGQTVELQREGNISIYRPQMTLFLPSPPFIPVIANGWLELGDDRTQSGIMRFAAQVKSKTNFVGNINWVQLINRNTTYAASTTGFWLDNDPFYNTVNGAPGADPTHTRVDPRGLLNFQDNPGVGSAAYVSCSDMFMTYLVFCPDPQESSLWVTLGIVNWGWLGTETAGYLSSSNVVAPTYTDQDDFPTWLNTIHIHR